MSICPLFLILFLCAVSFASAAHRSFQKTTLSIPESRNTALVRRRRVSSREQEDRQRHLQKTRLYTEVQLDNEYEDTSSSDMSRSTKQAASDSNSKKSSASSGKKSRKSSSSKKSSNSKKSSSKKNPDLPLDEMNEEEKGDELEDMNDEDFADDLGDLLDEDGYDFGNDGGGRVDFSMTVSLVSCKSIFCWLLLLM